MLTVSRSQGTVVNNQSELRYRALLRDGNIPQIKIEFPEYFTGRPATDSNFGLEKVTRPDLQSRMIGLYLDTIC